MLWSAARQSLPPARCSRVRLPYLPSPPRLYLSCLTAALPPLPPSSSICQHHCIPLWLSAPYLSICLRTPSASGCAPPIPLPLRLRAPYLCLCLRFAASGCASLPLPLSLPARHFFCLFLYRRTRALPSCPSLCLCLRATAAVPARRSLCLGASASDNRASASIAASTT